MSSKREKAKPISVKIQPTIGESFKLSLLPGTKISALKETISDRMGLSPQKMSLLHHNSELSSGTLVDNSIHDGSELQLVPALESGVTTVNSVDPVAMMKHSMSGISDEQIDDFLNGKCPLSVAIRVGESVVVVNLHRAKVEEIAVEPPPVKRRCTRPTRHVPESVECSPSRSSSAGLRHLNTNTGSNDRHSPIYDYPSSVSTPGPSRSRTIPTDAIDGPCSSSILREHTAHCSDSSGRVAQRETDRKTPDNGISVKRKAVMEAISEILKKMYANSDKGRLPGSFRGRFSSEFTCDNDMREILHSKTTMTGYGTEDDERLELVDQQCLDGSLPLGDSPTSKAKNEENEQLRNKVASLKWKMQKTRAIKKAKRLGKSPCGWMESLNCDMPLESPMVQEQSGFCGMKRGFLMAD